MIGHDRARELAAIAIDFELEPAERAELDAHLGSCDDCRAVVASLAGDALALASLPRVDAPEQVRRSVIAGRPGRSGGTASPLLAALVVLVLTVVPLGAGAILFGDFGLGIGGSPASTPAPAPPMQTGAPTLPPSPSPSPSSPVSEAPQ